MDADSGGAPGANGEKVLTNVNVWQSITRPSKILQPVSDWASQVFQVRSMSDVFGISSGVTLTTMLM